jgi:hypothetical protein
MPVTTGAFPGAIYASRWTVYPDGWADTSGQGTYAPSKVLSVRDGMLTFDLHTDADRPLGAAAVPVVASSGARSASGAGQVYGRYSVRFRADSVPGYGLAWLLWPDSNTWPSQGEIDFPEGSLTGKITGNVHHADPAGGKDTFGTGSGFSDWHVATMEWLPGEVSLLLDGRLIGTSTTRTASDPMHLVLQAGTDGGIPASHSAARPPRTARGVIQVDWVVIYALA